jgi:hypothetical protein
VSYPVSAEFLAAMKRSHSLALRAELLDNAGNVQRTFDVLSGSVTADAGRSVRRTCDAALADPDGALTPGELDDLFAPGQEVKLYRGLHLPTGPELVPQGVFRIGKASVRDTGDRLSVALTGKDRSETIRRARFTDTYVITEGTNVADAIRTLISGRTGISRFNFMLTSHTTPRIVAQAGDDPWELAESLARNIGGILFFDRDGIPTLRPEPDSSASSALTLAEGAEAMLSDVESTLDESKTYNHVIVTGESTDNAAPIRAEAQDDDPDSSTYVGGGFGDVPYFYTSRMIYTQAQAQDVADATLRRVLRLSRKVTATILPAPHLDADDVVKVTRARAKVARSVMVRRTKLSLSATETMTVESQEVRA